VTQNTHYMFNNFFPLKKVSFFRQCRKIWYSQTGHRWHHNTAHALCMPDSHGKDTDTHIYNV